MWLWSDFQWTKTFFFGTLFLLKIFQDRGKRRKKIGKKGERTRRPCISAKKQSERKFQLQRVTFHIVHSHFFQTLIHRSNCNLKEKVSCSSSQFISLTVAIQSPLWWRRFREPLPCNGSLVRSQRDFIEVRIMGREILPRFNGGKEESSFVPKMTLMAVVYPP